MNFRTRKLIKPEDLNGRNTLFGGRLLEWIDEECYIFSSCQLDNTQLVTKFVSEINFVSPAYQGEVIEIGVETTVIGTTSITLHCCVRNKVSKKTIIDIEKIVFVTVDSVGKPTTHRIAQQAICDKAG